MATSVVLICAYSIHVSVSIVASIVVGLSFGPLTADTISYCQQNMPLSGRQVSVFMLGFYSGFMVLPAFTGYLFTKYSPMSFLYVLVTGMGILVLMFLSIISYDKNKDARNSKDYIKFKWVLALNDFFLVFTHRLLRAFDTLSSWQHFLLDKTKPLG